MVFKPTISCVGGRNATTGPGDTEQRGNHWIDPNSSFSDLSESTQHVSNQEELDYIKY